MQNEVIELLHNASFVRKLDNDNLAKVAEFFCTKVEALVESEMRHHPLGFYYAVEKVSLESTMRYHVWPEGWTIPPSQAGAEIHDHVFGFNSLILTGEQRYETFDMSQNECGSHGLLEVTYSSDESVLHQTGVRVDLEHTANELLGAGNIYHLEPFVIHRATAIETPAVTLLLTKKDDQIRLPRVVVQHGGKTPTNFPRTLLRTQEIAEVRRILSTL